MCDVLANLSQISADDFVDDVVGMRNLAAHQYDDLEPRRAWRTVTIDVPALRSYLSDVVLPCLPEERA